MKQILEVYEDNKIIPFYFSPHTTHFMQPLDVVLFQPYKHWYSEAVNESLWTGYTNFFNQVEFLAELRAIQDNTFKTSTIKAAWREIGILPWNPTLVVDKFRACEVLLPVTLPTTLSKLLSNNYTPNQPSSLIR